MKTIINNLKKYMLISFVFIATGAMAAENVANPLVPELNNVELNSMFVNILAGNPTEPALEIENWMADASYWNYFWIAEADESEVIIENWMADPNIWKFSRNHDCAEINETDVPENMMSLDNWMNDTERWSAGS